MSQVVALQPVPNQTAQIILNGQNCQIDVSTSQEGLLFLTLFVNDNPIIESVICQNLNRIVRDTYLGFLGDLAFNDTQPDPLNGPSDPVYTGLGSRYQLIYFTVAEAGDT